MAEARIWAESYLGDADLGDARRTSRLVRMVARALESPGGKLSEVFESKRELDGAYDFVERDQTTVERLVHAVGRATAKNCSRGRVFVAVDGSSIQVIDRLRAKGMGRIGSDATAARGLKVISALAVDADGAVVGLLNQSWWARAAAKEQRTQRQKKKARRKSKPSEKETSYWQQSIRNSAQQLDKARASGWFQLDREGDAWPLLLDLHASGHWFTVRSAWDRVIGATGRDRQYLRGRLGSSPVLGLYELEVPANGARQARHAVMLLRATEVTLVLREERSRKKMPFPVRVVWVREDDDTVPPGEKPLDWMLLTNAPTTTVAEMRAVVSGYSMRWRVEEFHRTWKSGGCNVELTQLRSKDAVIRWATILAVVATRIERLKRLARTEPDRPASDELTELEIEVLVALKRRYKSRHEVIATTMPTIGQAVGWMAEIGGYTGKSSGGPPGSVTIRRGLERIQMAVEGVLAMRAGAG